MLRRPGPSDQAHFLLSGPPMARKERRRVARGDSAPRGATLRREIQQLKQQSEEILLRMDELLRELEGIGQRAMRVAPKK